jgi:hypothetical protein
MNNTASMAYWGPLLLKYETGEQLALETFKRFLNEPKQSANTSLASSIKDTRLISSDVNKDWFIESVLSKCVSDYINNLLNDFQLYSGKKDKTGIKAYSGKVHLGSLWMNIQKAGEDNPLHIHEGDLSFVYFMAVPKDLDEENKQYTGTGPGPGKLIFIYGQTICAEWAKVAQIIHPIAGNLYIFPSQLEHYVTAFSCKGERVSVSGNLVFV